MKINKLHYDFSPDKNQALIEGCNVSFEDVVGRFISIDMLKTVPLQGDPSLRSG